MIWTRPESSTLNPIPHWVDMESVKAGTASFFSLRTGFYPAKQPGHQTSTSSCHCFSPEQINWAGSGPSWKCNRPTKWRTSPGNYISERKTGKAGQENGSKMATHVLMQNNQLHFQLEACSVLSIWLAVFNVCSLLSLLGIFRSRDTKHPNKHLNSNSKSSFKNSTKTALLSR